MCLSACERSVPLYVLKYLVVGSDGREREGPRKSERERRGDSVMRVVRAIERETERETV